MWRSRSTRSAWCFACSVISAGAARRAGNGSGRGRTGRGAGRYRRAFRRQPGLIVQVAALRSGHAGPLRPARQLGEGRCPWRRDPAYHQEAALPPLAPAPRPAVPSWSRPCAAPIRGAGVEILAGIRLTNCAPCDACLLRLQAMFGDAGGVGELNPGAAAGLSRQGFRRTRGSPASAAAVGRITPWALSADTPEARPGLESDILFLSFSAFRRRAAGRGR